jgi:hypothetical protein
VREHRADLPVRAGRQRRLVPEQEQPFAGLRVAQAAAQWFAARRDGALDGISGRVEPAFAYPLKGIGPSCGS